MGEDLGFGVQKVAETLRIAAAEGALTFRKIIPKTRHSVCVELAITNTHYTNQAFLNIFFDRGAKW